MTTGSTGASRFHRDDILDTINPRAVILVDVSTANQSFDPPLRAFSIGVSGNVKVDTPETSAVVIPSAAILPGIQHSCVITKIYSSGTTATSIVGWR